MEAFLLSEDASFVDILHPRAEFKENSYKVQICNNKIVDFTEEDCFIKEEVEEEEEGEEEGSDVTNYGMHIFFPF